MLIRFIPVGALALVTAAGIAHAGAAKAPRGKKHLLVVTWTTGFRHADTIGQPDHDGPAQAIIADIGKRSGAFDVDYCRTQEDVNRMITPQGLRKYDGVMFLNTTGDLHIPDLHKFLDWIRAGHAFIGTHSASDTYHPNQIGGDTSYVDMLGAEFMTHHNQCEVDAIVNDHNHPAVKHLTPYYRVRDEIYLFKQNNRDKVHVLLSMDKHPNDGSPEANQPGDYLVSWCKLYGSGRVFYTSLGHRPDVWEAAPYQQHLLGGIRWALGEVKGDATPGNKPPYNVAEGR